MKIPNKILTEWANIQEHGDILAIREQSKINRITLSNAIQTGKMTEKTFTAISDFFNKKKERQNGLINLNNLE